MEAIKSAFFISKVVRFFINCSKPFGIIICKAESQKIIPHAETSVMIA